MISKLASTMYIDQKQNLKKEVEMLITPVINPSRLFHPNSWCEGSQSAARKYPLYLLLLNFVEHV